MKKYILLLTLLLVSLNAKSGAFRINGINYVITSEEEKTVAVFPGYYKTDKIYDDYSGDCKGDVVIPESVVCKGVVYRVTSINDMAFNNREKITSVTIPNSVKSIGYHAFENCSGLTSVNIGNGVTSIGTGAFYKCSGLTSVTIPNSVTSIGNSAFMYCSGLNSVTFGNSVTSIDGVAFKGCDGLTSISIPNSVKSIGENAFENCSNLTSVTIGNSVETIGANAFRACSGLTSVTIPNSVTSIGDFAFCGCSGLTSVTIGNGVTYIGRQAFCPCEKLASITFGNSLTQISYYAFDYTPWYENQPNGVIYAGTVAYSYKGEMPSNTHIKIKDGTLGIANSAFQFCGSPTSVTIPNSVTFIGDRAFSSCRWLTSVTIGNSVKYIGSLAFYECNNLTSINIPNSVTTIGSDAFYGCNLTSITIPNNVISIGARAFMWCSNITSITIGKSVTTIGEKAFHYCCNSSNSSITSLNPIPPKIEYLGEIINSYKATLYVPKGSGDVYRNAKYWKKFKNIIEIDVPSDSSEGDSNGDGNVDYGNIEEIKNYIMGSPSGIFNTEKADYNGDGVVNVADIVSIIDNNKWITVTDNFSKSIPFTKIRVLNNKSVSDQYCCVAFSTSPNEDIGTDRFYINFSSLTIGDNNPNSISWGNPITNYKHVGGNWYEYEFSCPVYFAFRQHNCPSGQVKVCIDATYTQLDYIERDANHTAEIGNIGVTLNDNMKFQLKVYPTNGGGQWIIGNDGTNDKDDFRLFWAGSNGAGDAKIYLDYGDDGVSGVGRRLLTASSISSLYELEVGNYYVKDLTNNNYILSGSTVTNANVDRTIGVFGNNDFGRIYYLKVFDGNTLIKNLIPVRRDCDGFVTLYDTISKTYLNTIAGTFKASDE